MMTHVIDYQGNGLHINATSENVRSDKNFRSAITEGVNDDVALLSFKFTSQASNLVTVLYEAFLNCKSALTGLIKV